MKIASVTIRRMVRASDPILAQVRTFTQHEGLNLRYERLQAAPIESGPQRIQIPVELEPEEVPTLVGEHLRGQVGRHGEGIGSTGNEASFRQGRTRLEGSWDGT